MHGKEGLHTCRIWVKLWAKMDTFVKDIDEDDDEYIADADDERSYGNDGDNARNAPFLPYLKSM